MFCMNCGQQLPEGAKFCMQCGTPQGAVSPVGTSESETINLDGNHTFVPAMCPNCNAHMRVDSSLKVARCDTCATECLVQDAIKALTVRGNVQVGNATINISGTDTDSLLQRVEMMLADGDFNGAMAKCDMILDSEPTNGKIYYYMLMSDLHCRNKNELANQAEFYDGNQYYIKAMQYGDPELKSELLSYTNKKYDIYLKNARVGAEIRFGHYANGNSVVWKILRIQNNKILIICRDNICTMPYHQPGGSITWAASSLRSWLNNSFINDSFTQAEQSRILSCDLNNENNSQYNTPGGVHTTDNVFLLSVNEANQLFENFNTRANGSWWWLRSPGLKPNYASYVGGGGGVGTSGGDVTRCGGVRPALWLKLD